MKKFIGKNLIFLTIILLLSSVGGDVKAAGCCKKIEPVPLTWPREFTRSVWPANDLNDCEKVCGNDLYDGGLLKMCRVWFTDNATIHKPSASCLNEAGCCQLSDPDGNRRRAYFASSQAECNAYCLGVDNCVSKYIDIKNPDAINKRCVTGDGSTEPECLRFEGTFKCEDGDSIYSIFSDAQKCGGAIVGKVCCCRKLTASSNPVASSPDKGCCECKQQTQIGAVVFTASMATQIDCEKTGGGLICTYKGAGTPDSKYQYCVASSTSQNYGADDTTYKGADRAEAQAIMRNFNFDAPFDPLGYAKGDPAAVIGRIIGGLLLILGSIALIMFIYGGFTWMTAMGNDKRVEVATKTLIWSTAGLVTIFLSYIIVGFLLDTATNTGSRSATGIYGADDSTTSEANSTSPATTPATSVSDSATLVVGEDSQVSTGNIYLSSGLTVPDSDIPSNWSNNTTVFSVPNSSDLFFVVGKGSGFSQSEASSLALENGKQQIADISTKAGYQIIKTKTVSGGIGNPTEIYYLIVFRLDN